MVSPDSLSQPRKPPHITVNSGSGGDIVGSMRSDSSVEPGTPGVTRELLPSKLAASRSHPGLYATPSVAESAEMLLPPSRSGRTPKPYSDLDSPRTPSDMSRRTSWSSNNGSEVGRRDSRHSPFASPFDDSRAPSRAGSDDEHVNTQTVSEKYNIMPSAGLLLFPEDVEKDDYLHNPDPNESDREKCDIWTKRGMTNVGGLLFITLGVLMLFVGYPALTFARNLTAAVPSGCASDPMCITDQAPAIKNIKMTLIDPDTPADALTVKDKYGKTLQLVFSDEFNTDGRTFYDGDDPYFQAVDIWYGVTQDIEWYDPDAASTANGKLNLKMDAFQSHNLNYRSGMLQSWNKLCFKGGRLEASISLPGQGDHQGFWPGFWAMGNLGRPGYPATTDGLWPYSYDDVCDAGITANQSDPGGLSLLPGMRLPACTCAGEDHPSPGKSRSAPEIDVLEASSGFIGPGEFDRATGTVSQSLQIAPFDIWYQPDYDYMEIYDHQITGMNIYRGGVYQEALSAVTWLNNDWYDGKAYQKYGFEYARGDTGYVDWFVGDEYVWMADARSLRPNGNVGKRVIPEEPMTIIANFGMSNSFAQVFLPNLAEAMPATMRLDYIRIYQDPNDISVTCDPPGYPTTPYIEKHKEVYMNQNLSLWSETNYTWPKNTLVNGCTA
ncbi:hypothetical protein HYFRA_00001681 [Hymenoscyphus fraxineus]|uniref:GH16 domain-containing protein n=1 Tax=Hymenoscyphus fraxineus TaxID=746836 RepID=A0A9N9L5B8_9HELO|nr:hypothetical protein HYFRA_00001681 [Hymenoscyphus fraxineus]